MGWILYWQMYCWAGWANVFFGDTGCQTDRDHQDHTAFGIDIDQHLRFEKG